MYLLGIIFKMGLLKKHATRNKSTKQFRNPISTSVDSVRAQSRATPGQRVNRVRTKIAVKCTRLGQAVGRAKFSRPSPAIVGIRSYHQIDGDRDRGLC